MCDSKGLVDLAAHLAAGKECSDLAGHFSSIADPSTTVQATYSTGSLYHSEVSDGYH